MKRYRSVKGSGDLELSFIFRIRVAIKKYFDFLPCKALWWLQIAQWLSALAEEQIWFT